MTVLIDLNGQRFGRLVVIARTEEGGKRVRWRCRCDCGTVLDVQATHLRSKHTTSCGCVASEKTATRNVASAKHGMWKTPEFQAWLSMRKRCYSKRNKRYPDYGGRGIKVCDEWLNDFAAFYAHVGPRPSAKHSLDRIRNGEGYKPGNVRWATDGEQNNNKRANVTAFVGGEQLTAAQIASRYGLGHGTVLYRIRAGKTEAELIAPSTRKRTTARIEMIEGILGSFGE